MMLGSVGDILHGYLTKFRQWRCSHAQVATQTTGEEFVGIRMLGDGWQAMEVNEVRVSHCWDCGLIERETVPVERMFKDG